MHNWQDFIERAAGSAASRTSVAALASWVGLLMLAFIPPNGVLNGNEEYYFQLAYKYLNPDFPAAESAIMGSRPHMLFFVFPVGHLVEWLGFEAAQIVTRLLVAACYTVALVRLFRALNFRAIDAVAVLLVFYLLGQQVLGGEWLFDGAEAKSFAYPLLILAIALVLDQRLLLASTACAAATYFHFLAGGFWFAALWLCLLLTATAPRRLLAFSAMYVVLVIPLAYVILSSYGPMLAAPPPDPDLPPTAWITGVFRNAALTAPFSSVWQFVTWSPRIGFLLGLWIVSTWFLRFADPKFGFIARLAFLVLTWLVGALVVSSILAAFGKDYLLAAFFPFRPSSLALLLWLSAGAHAIRQLDFVERHENRVLLAAIVVCGAVAAPKALDRSVLNVIRDHRQEARQAGLNEYIDSRTERSEVFVVHVGLEGEFWKFERERRRPVYSFRKFTSVDKNGVYEWYGREQERERLSSSGCAQVPDIRADFLVVPADFGDGLIETCGAVVYADENYLLIEIRQERASARPPLTRRKSISAIDSATFLAAMR